MAAADYRLMSEATGKRIAAALEALSGFGAYLTTEDVVNNLTSTATDQPLSAAQGKALNEAIAQSTAISEKINLSTKSVPANDDVSWTIDVSKSGYKALLAFPVRLTSAFTCYYCDITNNTLLVAIHNLVNDARSTGDSMVLVLYVPT